MKRGRIKLDLIKYKNLWYSKEVGKKKIRIETKVFYRYMDKIYIPNKVESLSKEDTKSLSEIRVILDQDVIDYKYSRKVTEYLLHKIPKNSRKNLADFGCGGGFLLNCIPDYYGIEKYIGLDFADETLEITREKFNYENGFEKKFYTFSKDDLIPVECESISAVISCFVMHFEIYEEQIKEIYRVLSKNGVFVYNDYNHNKNKIRTSHIINLLIKNGFKVKEEIKIFKQDGIDKSHKIIEARKK